MGLSEILDCSRRFVLQVPLPGPCISHCGCSLWWAGPHALKDVKAGWIQLNLPCCGENKAIF